MFHLARKRLMNFEVNAHNIAIKLSKIPPNSISESLFFKISLGGMPSDP